MRCPYCQHDNDSVRDSRSVEDGKSIRRRRVCNNCERRFTTYERIVGALMVVKKNGEREAFDRTKIERGLQLACHKRAISASIRARIAEDIETELTETYEAEVSSQDIGVLCMRHLAQIDQVAYVRFASVYREFQDVDDFVQELGPMLEGENC